MSSRNTRKVYILDEHAGSRQEAIDQLTRNAYEPVAFASASRFIGVLESLPFGCVVYRVATGCNGVFDVLHTIANRRPDLPVIVLSDDSAFAATLGAIAGGRIGCAEGARRLSTQVEQRLDGRGRSNDPGSDDDRRRQEVVGKLSARELEVLELLLAGHKNRAVAAELGISPRTVEVHRARMMRRLGVKNFTELIRLAVEVGVTRGKRRK